MSITCAVAQLKEKGYYFNRDIKELDSISFKLIDQLLDEEISNQFVMDRESLISCIQAMAISEGSVVTKKGSRAFRSSLFLLGNNPFGIKGKGSRVTTVEYFNGKRYVLKQNFQRYDNFGEALEHLIRILMLPRYNVTESKD